MSTKEMTRDLVLESSDSFCFAAAAAEAESTSSVGDTSCSPCLSSTLAYGWDIACGKARTVVAQARDGVHALVKPARLKMNKHWTLQ